MDASAHLRIMKPPVTMKDISTSHEHVEEAEKVESREAKEARMESIRKQEVESSQARQREEEERRNQEKLKKEEVAKKKEAEKTQRKVQRYLAKIPDFGFLFSDKVVAKDGKTEGKTFEF